MAGFAYYVIQRNDTTNDSIFHMSGGMQGVYSKMLGVVRILFLVSWVQELTLTLSCGQVATHIILLLMLQNIHFFFCNIFVKFFE